LFQRKTILSFVPSLHFGWKASEARYSSAETN
jgi:hypothetical protein